MMNMRPGCYTPRLVKFGHFGVLCWKHKPPSVYVFGCLALRCSDPSLLLAAKFTICYFHASSFKCMQCVKHCNNFKGLAFSLCVKDQYLYFERLHAHAISQMNCINQMLISFNKTKNKQNKTKNKQNKQNQKQPKQTKQKTTKTDKTKNKQK